VACGLIVVDERGTGRGRASTVILAFAESGPWREGEINAELFEAVLAYSSVRGPARLLLAAMAAVADELGEVRDLSAEQLSAAAGIADRSYRRARQELLANGAVILVSGVGGRGNTNVWTVVYPRRRDAVPTGVALRRVAPPPGARPLLAAAGGAATPNVDQASTNAGKGGQDQAVTAGNCPIVTGVSLGKAGQDRTVSAQKCPVVTGVSVKGGQDQTVPAGKCPVVTGVSVVKGGQDRTLFDLPAPETPAETPAPNARAGTEPGNQTTSPPSPPDGGYAEIGITPLYADRPVMPSRRGGLCFFAAW
jgi:hypothetical protein